MLTAPPARLAQPNAKLYTIEVLEPRIVLSAGALNALNAKLAEFAADKTTPPATPTVPTLTTAKADDVVFAVYQLTLTPDFNERDEVSDLVVTALEELNGKARPDRNTIAPRILNAALQGSGLSGADDVAEIMAQLIDVNSGEPKLELSNAGKAEVVEQALRSTNNGNPSAGAEIGAAAALLLDTSSSLNPDAALATFTISALNGLGTATSQVRSFIESILVAVEGSTEAFAFKVAAGLAKNSALVGQVIGGLADDLDDPDEIKSLTKH